jgi:hypothetical protein
MSGVICIFICLNPEMSRDWNVAGQARIGYHEK